MKKLLLTIFCAICGMSLSAQQHKITDTMGYRIITDNKLHFPKFYKALQQALEGEDLLKQVVFIDNKSTGPAFASPKGIMTINLDYFKGKKPNFDDNRLLVVLYHEIGHFYYYHRTPRSKWNSEDSEKAAFEYSLLKTKEMAASKDCLPLKTGLRFMKLRSESNALDDPHVRALKKMVNEPLYTEYLAYVKANCN
jgi:hypothetical protein